MKNLNKITLTLFFASILFTTTGIFLLIFNKNTVTTKQDDLNKLIIDGYQFSKLKIKSYDGNNVVYITIEGNKMDNFKYFTLEFTTAKEQKIIIPFLIS